MQGDDLSGATADFHEFLAVIKPSSEKLDPGGHRCDNAIIKTVILSYYLADWYRFLGNVRQQSAKPQS